MSDPPSGKEIDTIRNSGSEPYEADLVVDDIDIDTDTKEGHNQTSNDGQDEEDNDLEEEESSSQDSQDSSSEDETESDVDTNLSHLTLNGISGLDTMTIEKFADLIKNKTCHKILVLSGAGVSVSAGIPDFRTKGTGLYDNLQRYNLPFPEAVFDLHFYRNNPQPFSTLAQELWPGTSGIQPTLSHYFIRLLQEKNVLLRNYTQNIDGLEVLAGVSPDLLVECHGHFRDAACIDCKAPYDGEACQQSFFNGIPPKCASCGGWVKPNVVFFGESLPPRFGQMIQSDVTNADMLIVMGTSLTVAPVSLIPEIVDEDAPRLLLNRDLVGGLCQSLENLHRDVWEGGDCDVSVAKLCDMLGWGEELQQYKDAAK